MLAYKSLCPSAWTSRWDDQRGECTGRAIQNCRNSRACYRICRIANIHPRERQLPRKAGPVNRSLRRSLACNHFLERKRIGSEFGNCVLEHLYHSDRYQQCSSGSRTPPRLHTQVRDVHEFTLDYAAVSKEVLPAMRMRLVVPCVCNVGCTIGCSIGSLKSDFHGIISQMLQCQKMFCQL
jgi:hypothetical protein